MRRLWSFVKKGAAGLREKPVENAITIGVIAVALAILGAYMVFLINANALMEKWRGDLAIIVFLEPGLDEADMVDLRDSLRAIPEVQTLVYVSSEVALQAFVQDVPGYGELFETLGRNPLPSSFELRLRTPFRNIADIERVAAPLAERPGVDEVYYGKQWIRRVAWMIRLTYTVGGAAGSFLLLGAVFIIYNTINLTILARRQEIEVQRLIGASDRFIYSPFVVEGMMQGLIGSAVAIVVVAAGFHATLGVVGSETGVLFGAIRWSFLPPSFLVGLVLGGMTLGVVGSAISISRVSRV
jgi:cell division transport system permease protein